MRCFIRVFGKNEESTFVVNSVIYLSHPPRSHCGRDIHFHPLYAKLRGLPQHILGDRCFIHLHQIQQMVLNISNTICQLSFLTSNLNHR